MNLPDPRSARAFHFVARSFAGGVANLVYAFDDGPELVERISFPSAPGAPAAGSDALEAALDLLHWIAGISYYKAGVPAGMRMRTTQPDAATASFLDALYLHGLGEFAYRNQLDLRGRIRFPAAGASAAGDAQSAPARRAGAAGRELDTARVSAAPDAAALARQRTLVPIGGGKDSLVSVEILKAAGADATAVWVGNSPLIAACARRTGLPMLNIGRELSPILFEYNRLGAYNGHIPVTAINSAILVVAAVLHGFDAIAFSNERSASSATLEYAGQPVNHQWSKGWAFEQAFHALVKSHVAPALDYYSLLRPLSELAVAERFARASRYDTVFSSCNRNFRILGPRPADRWCGQCPKCHFVFLALAPFMPKPRLLGIFGRNLLDDAALAPAFDALLEYRDHKPFECVGEGVESRAAMAALAARAEWREDALVARFAEQIAPQLAGQVPSLDALLQADGPHHVPAFLRSHVLAFR
ncbi:UDP-N-acetyl-alpha-D-muramoyl-L-alanyl-L-glutamate epimerase [Dokdonella sp.]|uniref:UDP-N-acetyl-alpha-D-muramoyl-L-alanyl-L- glutamate epimerase n=1 Tax=Dokdonella sp. TaxID=2291710 RepID=UPI0031C32BE1|nr:endonuclease domain-containing protein [Dokdonella sp.]